MQPACRKCAKAAIQCEGYERQLTWKTAAVQRRRKVKIRVTCSAPRSKDEVLADTQRAESFWVAETSSLSSDSPDTSLSLASNLSSPAVATQQLVSHWIDFYQSSDEKQHQSNVGAWVLLCVDLQGTSTALDFALLALSSVRLGRTWGNTALIRLGHEFYTRALYATQHSICSTKEALKDATLAACQLLKTYEASGTCWTLGICIDLEARSKRAHRTRMRLLPAMFED